MRIKFLLWVSSWMTITALSADHDILVRVLLASVEHTAPTHWYIESVHKEYINITAPGISRKRSLRVRIGTKDQIIMNGRCVQGNMVTLTPSEGDTLTFEGVQYAGSIIIIRDQSHTFLINSVPLETYVMCVLRTESWPGWPLEVNKALAVASRTYVIDKILESRRRGRAYHIKNSNVHQTYKGLHDRKELRQACAETAGLFIAHQGNPVQAMFDSCCGGVTPAHMHNAHKLPVYLRRTQHCSYCKDSRAYRWIAEYSGAELAHGLREGACVSTSGTCTRAVITHADSAGLVHEMRCTVGGREYTINRSQIYRCLKKLRSTLFTVKKVKNKFLFEGRGIGHHLGLCQWGARALIDCGWSWKRILQFYYPGTTLMRVRVTT